MCPTYLVDRDFINKNTNTPFFWLVHMLYTLNTAIGIPKKYRWYNMCVSEIELIHRIGSWRRKNNLDLVCADRYSVRCK